jgi:hypothetical protein
MTTLLIITGVVLATIIFVQMGALVELYRQVQQIRVFLDMVDNPESVELPAKGRRPGTVGFPAELDTARRAAVLVLSNKCLTCRTLAERIRGDRLPPGLWIMVVPVLGDVTAFVAEFELVGPRVFVDHDQHISENLGIEMTPVAVVVEDGLLAEAQTVPTVRQMNELTARIQGATVDRERI